MINRSLTHATYLDVDFLPLVRDYLKNVWAPQVFGRDNVCSVSTYGTLGIRQALLDVTKVYGISKDEIQSITRTIEDKDNEGKDITWDKAFEMYPALKDYCQRYPEISEAAQVLTDRNKSGGVHAGGLIISSKPIADFVPLEIRSVNKDNKYGVIVAAWTEGLDRQDLQPVGLVKFDLLVVDGLMQVALGCKMIKERHGVESICALPGKRNWSDTSYLNDPKCLEMANKGDLKCIFQFGSEGIRKLTKRSGVTCFDDIAILTSLYRPSALSMGTANAFCDRKRGIEKYAVHPLLEPILGKGYGILIFQEDCLQVLHVVGDIPLIYCEKIRKAISKKKVEEFAKYKEMFLANGQKNLDESLEYVTNLWNQIEAFAGYSFNRSHAYAYSYISAMQLWLKVYYPIEFYAAMFQCENDDKKIKQYKLDAQKHGIELLPITLNKSKTTFEIIDDKIYYGYSNLKGIGESVAERIVVNQPYTSLTDFLERFGTDATVVRALIAFGCFGDDVINQYKAYEHYKKLKNSKKASDKRYSETQDKNREEIKSILSQHLDPSDVERYSTDSTLWDRFSNISVQKGKRTISVTKLLLDLEKKIKTRKTRPSKLTLADIVIEDKVKVILEDRRVAEKEFYGFSWRSELEDSPDYEGFTIDHFNEEYALGSTSCIDIKVLEITRKNFKSGKGHAFDVKVEDADGKEIIVKFWSDDYEKFKKEVIVGNLLRIRVKPPVGNFSSYSFESVAKHEKWKLPKKEDDCRLIVLRRNPGKNDMEFFDL